MDFSPSKNIYIWNQFINLLLNYKYVKVLLEKDHASDWSKELSPWKFGGGFLSGWLGFLNPSSDESQPLACLISLQAL